MSKMNNSTANLSDRLKDMLFNKRDEGYYFRKFQREKSLEVQNQTQNKIVEIATENEKSKEPNVKIKIQRSTSTQNLEN